jgi:hypothetical protein
MNNSAAAAVVIVFLLVAAIFGNPTPSGAAAPESPVAAQSDR